MRHLHFSPSRSRSHSSPVPASQPMTTRADSSSGHTSTSGSCDASVCSWIPAESRPPSRRRSRLASLFTGTSSFHSSSSSSCSFPSVASSPSSSSSFEARARDAKEKDWWRGQLLDRESERERRIALCEPDELDAISDDFHHFDSTRFPTPRRPKLFSIDSTASLISLDAPPSLSPQPCPSPTIRSRLSIRRLAPLELRPQPQLRSYAIEDRKSRMPSLKKSLRREPSSADEEEDDGIFGWQAPTGVLPRHDLITPFLAPPSLSSGDASSARPPPASPEPSSPHVDQLISFSPPRTITLDPLSSRPSSPRTSLGGWSPSSRRSSSTLPPRPPPLDLEAMLGRKRTRKSWIEWKSPRRE